MRVPATALRDDSSEMAVVAAEFCPSTSSRSTFPNTGAKSMKSTCSVLAESTSAKLWHEALMIADRSACRKIPRASSTDPGCNLPGMWMPSAIGANARIQSGRGGRFTKTLDRCRSSPERIRFVNEQSASSPRSFSRIWMKSTPPRIQPATKPRSSRSSSASAPIGAVRHLRSVIAQNCIRRKSRTFLEQNFLRPSRGICKIE